LQSLIIVRAHCEWQNRPPTPSLISSVIPILSSFSPQLVLLLRTSLHYIALLSICLNDLAVLLFCIGLTVLVGKYATGGNQSVAGQVVEDAWNSVKGEL
jgi:hypothetical protein